MSNKSSRGPKSLGVKMPPPEPRAKAALDSEETDLVALAGKLQYNIFVLTEQLTSVNNALHNNKNETLARNELDAKQQGAPV